MKQKKSFIIAIFILLLSYTLSLGIKVHYKFIISPDVLEFSPDLALERFYVMCGGYYNIFISEKEYTEYGAIIQIDRPSRQIYGLFIVFNTKDLYIDSMCLEKIMVSIDNALYDTIDLSVDNLDTGDSLPLFFYSNTIYNTSVTPDGYLAAKNKFTYEEQPKYDRVAVAYLNFRSYLKKYCPKERITVSLKPKYMVGIYTETAVKNIPVPIINRSTIPEQYNIKGQILNKTKNEIIKYNKNNNTLLIIK